VDLAPPVRHDDAGMRRARHAIAGDDHDRVVSDQLRHPLPHRGLVRAGTRETFIGQQDQQQILPLPEVGVGDVATVHRPDAEMRDLPARRERSRCLHGGLLPTIHQPRVAASAS